MFLVRTEIGLESSAKSLSAAIAKAFAQGRWRSGIREDLHRFAAVRPLRRFFRLMLRFHATGHSVERLANVLPAHRRAFDKIDTVVHRQQLPLLLADNALIFLVTLKIDFRDP